MTYALPDNISYCLCEGSLVFLDITADRYFALDAEAETTFRALGAGRAIDDARAQHLVGLKIVTSGTGHPIAPPDAPLAAKSALEQASRPRLNRMTDLFLVAYALHLTDHRLLRGGLKFALDAFKQQNTSRHQKALIGGQPGEAAYIAATRRYIAARKYLPGDVICLRDSLALAQFLNWSHLPVTLILAVIAKPFAAHAWLQWKDLALNETVGLVRHHTPIYVAQ